MNSRSNPRNLIRRIQMALSLDLRHPSYPPSGDDFSRASRAQGYVAAEAAYHLLGPKAGYTPCMRRNADGTTHWWLIHRTSGEVLDPTAPQLGGKAFPYHRGQRRAFRTRNPSRRTAELMRRVRRALG